MPAAQRGGVRPTIIQQEFAGSCYSAVFGIPLIAQMCELPNRNSLRASCH